MVNLTSGYLITWYRLLPSPVSVHLFVIMVLTAVQGTMATYKLPVFVDMESNVTANKGSEVILYCGARHLGTKQIIWKKADTTVHQILTVGNMVFTDDKSIAVQHRRENHRDMWNLVIKDVALRHSGLYECQISTQEDLKRYVMLNVLDVEVPYGIDKGIVLTGKEYVEKGEPIVLTCNISGDVFLSSDVDWFKNGKVIHPDTNKGKHIITHHVYETRTLHSVLTIDHSSMDDMGIYVCRSNAGSEVKITSRPIMVLNALNVPNTRKKPPITYPDDKPIKQRDLPGKEKPDHTDASSGTSRQLLPARVLSLLCLLTVWFSSSHDAK